MQSVIASNLLLSVTSLLINNINNNNIYARATTRPHNARLYMNAKTPRARVKDHPKTNFAPPRKWLYELPSRVGNDELTADEHAFAVMRYGRCYDTHPTKLQNHQELWPQIVYSIVRARAKSGYETINHAINVIFKIIKDGRWKIPFGFKKYTEIGRKAVNHLAAKLKEHMEIKKAAGARRQKDLEAVKPNAVTPQKTLTSTAEKTNCERISLESFRRLKSLFAH